MKIKEILRLLDGKAPFKTAEGFDNVGLLVGSEDREIARVLCCLDITRGVIEEAVEKGAELIVAHHPVIFTALKNIPDQSPVMRLIENNLAAAAMHTNLDIANGGVNDALVGLLGFEKLCTLDVTQADGTGFGAVCGLPKELSVRELAGLCRNALGTGCVRFSAGCEDGRKIRRAAVCCGAGLDANIMRLAEENGCEAIITGDIKHNFWIEAEFRGIALIDAGHYQTEIAAKRILAKMISDEFPELCVIISENETNPCGYI
ncbi:MAG: Nif3-like dinuclear metal center hexameric protein [Oscillospiraceae bacterium]|nr:Nif3-like dinuclear metal center hexameric protein [Oscillospiraceae bacterium]